MDSKLVKKKRLAIISLVCGIIGGSVVFTIFSVPAIICGHIALRKIKKFPEAYGGKGMAIAGVILGYIGLVLGVVTATLRVMANQQIQGLR